MNKYTKTRHNFNGNAAFSFNALFLQEHMNTEALYNLFLNCGMQVSTDTRRIQPGAMFFALKGENFNGNAFALKAIELGAGSAVVDEDHGFGDDVRIVKVGDALKALQDLANLHRKLMGVRLLAIGGSNGKTTTKELIVSVLSGTYNVHFTQGNLNNHIGLPLTLLQLRRAHQIAVVEMGANKEGDIRELCDIAEPELGLITNIGKEHLEGFGSMEGVVRAESELFDYLVKHSGHAFVNADDSWLKNMAKRLSSKTVYGRQESSFSNEVLSPSIHFTYKDTLFSSPLMGEHNLQNIMAAVAVAEYFKVPLESIKNGIALYAPTNNRSQWVHTEKGNIVLLDAYNANPSSVEMALKVMASINGNKVVLLGDMFELGAHEAEEHQHIAGLCGELTQTDVILVGKAFDSIQAAFPNTKTFATKSEAEKYVSELNCLGKTVLIKGSRGMKMEDFLKYF